MLTVNINKTKKSVLLRITFTVNVLSENDIIFGYIWIQNGIYIVIQSQRSFNLFRKIVEKFKPSKNYMGCWTVTVFNFLGLCKSFPKWVRSVAFVIQKINLGLFHVEKIKMLNNWQHYFFIFDVLSENVMTFFEWWLFLQIKILI